MPKKPTAKCLAVSMTRLESLAQNVVGIPDGMDVALSKRSWYRVRRRTPVVNELSVPAKGPVDVNCSSWVSSADQKSSQLLKNARLPVKILPLPIKLLARTVI